MEAVNYSLLKLENHLTDYDYFRINRIKTGVITSLANIAVELSELKALVKGKETPESELLIKKYERMINERPIN